MVGGADAMLEAYRFGVSEGPHRWPWMPAYHREAVHVYGGSLPWTYQRDIAKLFGDCLSAMAQWLIPSELAEDWAIVTAYMREAAGSIEDWLASVGPRLDRSEVAGSAEPATDTPSPFDDIAPTASSGTRGASGEPAANAPRVVHWDALAGLTTQDGTRRLKNACVAVIGHLDVETPRSLETSERLVLQRLVSGAAIATVASEMGYSERQMYRELSRLWDKLGVSGRAAGVHKATVEGLID
ncbi:MAG: hypothetical protein F4Z90_13180 [Acidimicrobiaceae bacterium]|nr:hypothetical protein [Acidimicrobiaceae bacterium]